MMGVGDDDDESHGSEATAPTVADLVAASVLNAGYRVVCSLPPWSSMTDKQIGRITTWPEHKPYELRSISCQCYRHSGCKSRAYKTRQATEQMLMTWLYSGKVEPGCTKGRTAELKQEHLDLLDEVVRLG